MHRCDVLAYWYSKQAAQQRSRALLRTDSYLAKVDTVGESGSVSDVR